MKKIILLIILSVVLFSCTRTVRWDVKNPAFQTQNRPIRELRVCAVMDGSRSKEKVEKLVAKVSESQVSYSSHKQVGISLKIIKWHTIPSWLSWNTKKIEEKAEKIREFMLLQEEDSGYDIAICFTKHAAGDISFTPRFNEIEFKQGYTDHGGRVIIINQLNARVLLHELLCHCFSVDHSKHGLCAYNPNRRDYYISREDRLEVLKNKWHEFR